MSNGELKIFNYENNEVRTTVKDGEVWWVLKDVCDVLGLSNSRKVAERLDDDEKGVTLSDTLGGTQKITIINEAGLYKVILRSDKPEAKKFMHWERMKFCHQSGNTGLILHPQKWKS